MATWPPKTILQPTDFSPNAEQAFKVACQIAESANARIVVLHAFMIEAFSTGDLPVVSHEMESEEDVGQAALPTTYCDGRHAQS